jgi:hypothetical protein
MRRMIIIAALVVAASPAYAQAPQSGGQTGDAQAQLRFQPVTRPSDPVGTIYAAAVPGGCLLVFGVDRLPSGANTAQGGVFVPGQGCPRAVPQQGR